MEGRAVVHRCRSRRKFDARVRERLLKGELALLVVGLAVELLDAALLRFAVQIKDARGKKRLHAVGYARNTFGGLFSPSIDLL